MCCNPAETENCAAQASELPPCVCVIAAPQGVEAQDIGTEAPPPDSVTDRKSFSRLLTSTVSHICISLYRVNVGTVLHTAHTERKKEKEKHASFFFLIK